MADYSEVISDNVGISDQRQKCLEIIITNSLSLEDSISRKGNWQRIINETENINDLISKEGNWQRTIREIENIHDLARDQWIRINLAYTIFY